MTRARVISAIVLIAAAGAALAAWLWPTRSEPQRGESFRAGGATAESGPALAALPESRDAAAAKAAAKAGAKTPEEVSPASRDEASKDAFTTLRVEVRVGDKVRPGVTVRVRALGDTTPLKSAATDASGFVEFEHVDPKAIVVEAFGEGLRIQTWQRGRGSDACWQDATGIVHLSLAEGIPLHGRILDVDTGLPVPGASVVVRDWTDDFEVGPSDATGGFDVGGVMNDNVTTITVRARGYSTKSLEMHVDGGKAEPAAAVVRVSRGSAIVGVVRAPDGTPFPGARVRVDKRTSLPVRIADLQSEAPPRTEELDFDDSVHEEVSRFRSAEDPLEVLTDATGAFRVEGIAFDADYEATASAPGCGASLPVSRIRASSGAAEPSATLVLRRLATVLVTVSYPAGVERTGPPRIRLFVGPDRVLRKPVLANGKQGSSEQETRFEVEPGAFVAFAQQEGFLSAVRSGSAIAGEPVTITIPLESGATVEGIVVDHDGAPVTDAQISVALAKGQDEPKTSTYLSYARTGTSGPDGRFSVTGVHPGPVMLVARQLGGERLLTTRERLELTAPARDVRVVMLRQGAVHMRLIGPDGTPFTGNTWIRIDSPPSDRADEQEGPIERGEVEMTGLTEGPHVLLVSPSAYQWIRRPFEILDGATVDLGDVRLEPGTTLSGRLLDATGKPVVGALVKCLETERRSTKTDADGRFALDRFPREVVTLKISAPGFTRMNLVVEPAKQAGLEIRMSRPATISVTTQGADWKAADCIELILARPGAKPEAGEMTVGTEWGETERDWSGGGSIYCGEDEKTILTLPTGRWTVWWRDADGKDRAIAEWTIEDGETRTIDVVLPAK